MSAFILLFSARGAKPVRLIKAHKAQSKGPIELLMRSQRTGCVAFSPPDQSCRNVPQKAFYIFIYTYKCACGGVFACARRLAQNSIHQALGQSRLLSGSQFGGHTSLCLDFSSPSDLAAPAKFSRLPPSRRVSARSSRV